MVRALGSYQPSGIRGCGTPSGRWFESGRAQFSRRTTSSGVCLDALRGPSVAPVDGRSIVVLGADADGRLHGPRYEPRREVTLEREFESSAAVPTADDTARRRSPSRSGRCSQHSTNRSPPVAPGDGVNSRRGRVGTSDLPSGCRSRPDRSDGPRRSTLSSRDRERPTRTFMIVPRIASNEGCSPPVHTATRRSPATTWSTVTAAGTCRHTAPTDRRPPRRRGHGAVDNRRVDPCGEASRGYAPGLRRLGPHGTRRASLASPDFPSRVGWK